MSSGKTETNENNENKQDTQQCIYICIYIYTHTQQYIRVTLFKKKETNRTEEKAAHMGSSPTTQWLRLCAPDGGASVWSMVRKLRSHRPHGVVNRLILTT